MSLLRVLKKAPLFPVLLAVLPSLSLYATNIHQLVPSVLFSPLLIALAAMVVLWILGIILYKDVGCGALFSGGLLLYSILIGQFFHQMDQTLLGKFLLDEYRWAWGLLSLWPVILLGRRIRTLVHAETPILFLNIVSGALLLMPVGRVLVFYAHSLQIPTTVQSTSGKTTSSPSGADRPDIYYIVLDGYAREDVLKSLYHYDNSAFSKALKKKGFFVADKSRSNYAFTLMSLSSSLDMSYHDRLSDNPDQEAVCTRKLSNNSVMRFLKDRGYQINQLSSGWVVTAMQFPLSDLFLSYRAVNDFSVLLLRTSWIRLFLTDKLYVAGQAEVIRYNLEKLKEIPYLKGPQFTFAHFVCPHPPYVFDRQGRLASRPKGIQRLEGDWEPEDRYVDQLVYITRAIDNAIDAILSRSQTPPIIILQSDHGPAARNLTATPDKSIVFRRTSILNAYYFPHHQYERLYPSITPVNSFRLIFNTFFKTGMDILPDRTYYSGPIGAVPYHFHDVSNWVSE